MVFHLHPQMNSKQGGLWISYIICLLVTQGQSTALQREPKLCYWKQATVLPLKEQFTIKVSYHTGHYRANYGKEASSHQQDVTPMFYKLFQNDSQNYIWKRGHLCKSSR